MGNSSSGAKHRHGSGEDTAPTLTAKSRFAETDLYDSGGVPYRVSHHDYSFLLFIMLLSYTYNNYIAVVYKGSEKVCLTSFKTKWSKAPTPGSEEF